MELDQLINFALDKTRSLIYYDRGNLHTRLLFSNQEFNDQSDAEHKIISDVKKVLNFTNLRSLRLLTKMLKEIDIVLKPKSFKAPVTPSSHSFHTNVDWSNTYDAESFNYFINCSPVLHVISTMWLMGVGVLLDNQSSPDSYGYTLHKSASNPQSIKLFKYYAPEYSNWRDQAITKVKRTVTDDNQNATLVGLDLKQFFYHINVDWDKIDDVITNADWSSLPYDVDLAKTLTSIVKRICMGYKVILNKTIEFSHPELHQSKDLYEKTQPLPIGIGFSPILANWELTEFDNRVMEQLNPVYYGRYVDDLLLVVASHKLPFKDEEQNPRDEFLKQYFIKRELLEVEKKETKDGKVVKEYNVYGSKNLIIQESKIQIHHFDVKGSLGALDNFQNNIREIVSEFRFLPDSIPTEKLESLSHELKYQGSKHSLRSVKGFEVNQWSLSSILSNIASTRVLAPVNTNINIESKALGKLLSGILGMKFYDMWEKIFTVMILGEEYSELKKMYWGLKLRIKSIQTDHIKLTELTHDFYNKHLDLSLALPLALVGADNEVISKTWTSKRDTKVWESLTSQIIAFRESNLIRHHYVGSPLINFTNYKGDWTQYLSHWSDIEVDPLKITLSPRFIHLDEYQHAEFLMQVTDNKNRDLVEAYYHKQTMSEEESLWNM